MPVRGRGPAGWQGPLRAAVAVFLVGFLFVWLVKPLGNPCPDLASLPQGSTASSSPSLAPPGSRTCTYTATAGIKATAKYVPWLDWIVLLLVAAAVAGVVRMLSPAGRTRGPGARREPRAPAAGRAPLARPEPPRGQSASRVAAPSGPPRAAPPERADPSRAPAGERDAAERERARQERAARDRARRGR